MGDKAWLQVGQWVWPGGIYNYPSSSLDPSLLPAAMP